MIKKTNSLLSTVGRRKSAIANIVVTQNSESSSQTHSFHINSKPASEYLQNDAFLLNTIYAPLVKKGGDEVYTITAKVQGGGLVSQAYALRLAIARALYDPTHPTAVDFKKAGFLTRDARVKERRKYGLKKARKASQFSKR